MIATAIDDRAESAGTGAGLGAGLGGATGLLAGLGLAGLLDNVETSMRNEGHGASLRYVLEPLRLKPDLSVNLGVIVTEWVTNAFK